MITFGAKRGQTDIECRDIPTCRSQMRLRKAVAGDIAPGVILAEDHAGIHLAGACLANRMGLLPADELAGGGEAAVEDDGDDEGSDETVGPELIH